MYGIFILVILDFMKNLSKDMGEGGGGLHERVRYVCPYGTSRTRSILLVSF